MDQNVFHISLVFVTARDWGLDHNCCCSGAEKGDLRPGDFLIEFMITDLAQGGGNIGPGFKVGNICDGAITGPNI